MSETQAPYLDSQNDFGEHGHFTTHSDPGDMAPATANPARLGDATLPAALLGEATERPRMMVGRFPLDHRRANVALPDDREGELLDRLAAAEADVAFMRNTGQAVWQSLQAAEARVAALEFDLAAERAHAARLAAALTPFTDVLTKCFHLLPVYPDDQPLFTWRHVGGFEKFFYAGAARAIAAALAATPADSRERLQRLEEAVAASRAYFGHAGEKATPETIHAWMAGASERLEAWQKALDRLDVGKEGQ